MGDQEPFNEEALNRALNHIYRKRIDVAHVGPKVDVSALMRNGIGFHMESSDLVLVSSERMRRAKECGAVIES
jgi:thiamine monophosphate kinase